MTDSAVIPALLQDAYQPRLLSRSEFLTIRDTRLHLRHWGNPAAPCLFMLHGWMDVAASFQFVVDCLQREWHVIAPDWRGFGLSQRTQGNGYWYPDYLADLDAILTHHSPRDPVRLLGHSMGGNAAMLYAGVRPERIHKLINLEGFGLPDAGPSAAPARYASWLQQLEQTPRVSDFATLRDVMLRLQKTNPRLGDARAAFLAGHWSAKNAQDRWEILGDPLHKNVNPVLYRQEEAAACWQRITAPVLWVEGDDTAIYKMFGSREQARIEWDLRRTGLVQAASVESVVLTDAGHMLHHDQPAALAGHIERFLAS